MNTTNFIEIEKQRANAFNLFSSLLLEPDGEMLADGTIFKNLGFYLSELFPGKENEVSKLYSQIEKHSLQELQVEYARLFIGPFTVPSPPYSSLYFGEEIIMGNTTVWVKNFYEEAGLEFDAELKDLPDHAAVETEFMYYLIYNEVNTIDQGFLDDAQLFWERQKTFTEKHYNIWIPQFCDKVIEYSELEYFKIIFRNLKDLVTESKQPSFPLLNS